MDEVVFDGQGHITSDGAGFGFYWVGCAHHHAYGFSGVFSGDGDGYDWAGHEIVDDIVKEWAIFVLGVVGFYGFFGGVEEFESADFEATEFDSSDDFSVEVAGDSAGLDEDKSCFHDLGGGYRVVLGLAWVGGWGFGCWVILWVWLEGSYVVV